METASERFKTDLAKFSGNYHQFLVFVKLPNGDVMWRSTDDMWGTGVASRYLAAQNEAARIEERIFRQG